mmetsp:Transcript_17654/g.37089  ORF Transcript_17654/g.37089 Transcript_17654/m.37089 type:complete len:81 (-) Transcript_17654:279-521(-)
MTTHDDGWRLHGGRQQCLRIFIGGDIIIGGRCSAVRHHNSQQEALQGERLHRAVKWQGCKGRLCSMRHRASKGEELQGET